MAISVSPEELVGAAGELSAIMSVLGGVSMDDVSGAVGHGGLSAAVGEFQRAWGLEFSSRLEDLGLLAQSLESAAQEFTTADQNGARAFIDKLTQPQSRSKHGSGFRMEAV